MRRGLREGDPPRTMNPSNWEPPHLLVVEWVDWADTGYGFEAHVECPYPIYEYNRFVDPQLETSGVGFNPHGYTRDYRHYGHAGEHYCTMRLNMAPWNDGNVRPKVAMASTWHNPFTEIDERCARIEINATAGPQYGNCMYHYCIENVGLEDALGFREFNKWRLGQRPKPYPELPDEPGSYPIFYWSDGWGEDFNDGLTLDRPPVPDDLWEADVPTRVFHVSNVPS